MVIFFQSIDFKSSNPNATLEYAKIYELVLSASYACFLRLPSLLACPLQFQDFQTVETSREAARMVS